MGVVNTFMKSTEEYIKDYQNKYKSLSGKDELCRLRVSLQEFLQEIERIRNYEIEQKKSAYLTAYHIQSNIEGMISVMLMNKVSLDEAKQ